MMAIATVVNVNQVRDVSIMSMVSMTMVMDSKYVHNYMSGNLTEGPHH